MGASDWLDVKTIQAICKHISAAAVGTVAFAIIGVLIHLLWPDGLLKEMLEAVDGFVLLGLFGILGLKLLNIVWRGDGTGCILVG
jgi:hypothetical protein